MSDRRIESGGAVRADSHSRKRFRTLRITGHRNSACSSTFNVPCILKQGASSASSLVSLHMTFLCFLFAFFVSLRSVVRFGGYLQDGCECPVAASGRWCWGRAVGWGRRPPLRWRGRGWTCRRRVAGAAAEPRKRGGDGRGGRSGGATMVAHPRQRRRRAGPCEGAGRPRAGDRPRRRAGPSCIRSASVRP